MTRGHDAPPPPVPGRRRTRRGAAALALAVALLGGGLAACGKAAQVRDGEPGQAVARDGNAIGLLLPGSTDRWEKYDRPLLEKRIDELCPECTVRSASAQQEVTIQRQQIDAMITQGVRVLVLSAVDGRSVASSVEKARDAGIDVVAYDRLAEGPISGYVSFDGEEVGRLQARALLDALGDEAPDSRIVMMNGDPADPNSGWFKEGALSVLDGRVQIAKSYDTIEWRPTNAHLNTAGAIAALGADGVDGVYAANDGLASGVIAALKAARIHPLPPVTGQDAELAAIQRIVAGEQYMTVYKPFREEADAAARMAVALARGQTLDGIAASTVTSGDDSGGPGTRTHGIPAVLLTPVPVTADTIRDTVVADGLHTVDEICTPEYASACEKAGLTDTE
ncbi:sugar ABC transporter substrate-binding protein [Streptomyces sp. CC210A]|uniref:sugar ABC transporter substrate-binding protein n=1 Tax=Streptomyces sp. CC210A TaxID=2898184 RepID=UPI001F16EEC5|nr:substrate-binding domain-containing protein [Streptomyces sp. CC210A]